MSYQDYKKQAALLDIPEDLLDDESPAQAALRYILEAWEEGVHDGIEPEHLANAAIYAALCDLVSAFGEETVSKMTDGLAQRIEHGEFTINRTTQ